MTRAEAFKTAKHKSFYGHTTWLAWMGRDGSFHVARETAETLRAATNEQAHHGEHFYALSGGQSYRVSPKLAPLRLAAIDA